MSLSNEWSEYHLTSQGWELGTEKVDIVGIKEKPVPADRVLTLRFHEYQSCSFSSVDRWYDEIWRTNDKTMIDALQKKYGLIPGGYKDYKFKK